LSAGVAEPLVPAPALRLQEPSTERLSQETLSSEASQQAVLLPAGQWRSQVPEAAGSGQAGMERCGLAVVGLLEQVTTARTRLPALVGR
jgi:hypothetical protein